MALVRHSLTPLLAILDFRNSIESVGSDVPCSLFLMRRTAVTSVLPLTTCDFQILRGFLLDHYLTLDGAGKSGITTPIAKTPLAKEGEISIG